MYYLFLLTFLMIKGLVQAEEPSDAWLGHWLSGIEFTREQQNYPKAIETYTTAIRSLTPSQIGVQLNLINERGDLYLNMQDYRSALKDFSLVINHPQASQDLVIEALWGRSKVYLGSGKIQEFEKDIKRLNELKSIVTPLEESKDYLILKVNPYILRNVKSKEHLFEILMRQKNIQFEKEVIVTPSGLVIIKKESVK